MWSVDTSCIKTPLSRLGITFFKTSSLQIITSFNAVLNTVYKPNKDVIVLGIPSCLIDVQDTYIESQ